jgi:mannose-6-phosphate isomerase class I
MENIKILEPYLTKLIWGYEAWIASTHPKGESLLEGVKLSAFAQFPFLIKIISTHDNLSVQVHPDNEYARKYENDLGKNECWLILESEPNAGIYLGFNAGMTKDKFKAALDDKKDLSHYLNFYEVQKGDIFFVPTGTIHAIGAGVKMLEIQQSSGVTYRVWDWNRVDKNGTSRELHIDKAMEVLNFHESKNLKKESWGEVQFDDFNIIEFSQSTKHTLEKFDVLYFYNDDENCQIYLGEKCEWHTDKHKGLIIRKT